MGVMEAQLELEYRFADLPKALFGRCYKVGGMIRVEINKMHVTRLVEEPQAYVEELEQVLQSSDIVLLELFHNHIKPLT
jgi:hypothetical protein